MTPMRVLVTGAAGFVGSWLVRALAAEGHAVVGASQDGLAPAHSGAEGPDPVEAWLPLELTNDGSVREAVSRARPEAVVHLAAQSSVGASFANPLGTWDVNATGTLRLAQALAPGTRLLLVASAEAYGPVPEAEQPIAESRPLRPANPYAASKAAAEMAVLQAGAGERGIRPVVVRAFNHTGPGQEARFALPSFARQLAAIRLGRAEPVLRVGNLSARRDLLDVRDVVRAYATLLARGEPGGVYNVCAGRAVSIRQAVDALVEISGTRARIEVDPERVRPVDLPLLLGDASRLRALGWAPSIPLRRTLAELLAWHERELAAAPEPAA